jgi:hypothetical protein
MSDSDDKMRQDFIKWAKVTPYGQTPYQIYQAAYAAGRKAEREAMQLKNWDGIRTGTTSKPEGER